MSLTYTAENGNTVYRNEDDTFSVYMRDEADTERLFKFSGSAVKWADENEACSDCFNPLPAHCKDCEKCECRCKELVYS